MRAAHDGAQINSDSWCGSPAVFEMFKQLCRAALGMGAQPGAEKPQNNPEGKREPTKPKCGFSVGMSTEQGPG